MSLRPAQLVLLETVEELRAEAEPQESLLLLQAELDLALADPRNAPVYFLIFQSAAYRKYEQASAERREARPEREIEAILVNRAMIRHLWLSERTGTRTLWGHIVTTALAAVTAVAFAKDQSPLWLAVAVAAVLAGTLTWFSLSAASKLIPPISPIGDDDETEDRKNLDP